MMRALVVRALSFSAVAALMFNQAVAPVLAGDYRANAAPIAADGQMNARFLPLGIGKSVVIDLPRDIKDVLVADPKIANAVVRSAQRAYIIGAAVGQTNIFFFDSAGQQIAAYDIAVTRDLNGVRAALKQIAAECRHPDRRPRRRRRADRLGSEPGRGAAGAATRRAPGRRRRQGRQHDRGARPRPGDAEGHRRRSAARTIIKQLGIDLTGSLNYGTAVVNFNNTNPFTAYGRSLVAGNTIAGVRQRRGIGAPSVTATLRAMESAGVVRTLAEPNLTAISGESATFIAGGEFPIPAGYSCDPTTHVCTTQISFKKFGISLNFTPVVLTEGRISLRVMTEVSELSNDNSLTLSQSVTATTTNSVTIPSIKTRRAETTLEIPSGGSMAMAGLIAGADQAGDQRPARPDATADPRRAVQQPRLRQQPDRTDGAGHALCRARRRAEGSVAPG